MALNMATCERLAALDEVIRGVRYRPAAGILLAHDGRYHATANECEFPARTAVLLFRGKQGHYFLTRLSDWKDEVDSIVALTPGDAMDWYRLMAAKVLTWEEAFPTVQVKEA